MKFLENTRLREIVQFFSGKELKKLADCAHMVLRERDWYFIATQPAPEPHLAIPEGCAALRIVLVFVPHVSEHFLDEFVLLLLHGPHTSKLQEEEPCPPSSKKTLPAAVEFGSFSSKSKSTTHENTLSSYLPPMGR